MGLKRVTPYLKLDQINLSSKWPKLAVNGPNLPPKWPQQGSLRTAYLWTVPFFMIWITSGHFGPEIGGKPPKKTRPEERLFQSCFSYGVTHLKPNFLSPPWAKMKNFSAHQKAEDLRISKLTLLLFLVPFLGELWPLKHGELFFGTPCIYFNPYPHHQS